MQVAKIQRQTYNEFYLVMDLMPNARDLLGLGDLQLDVCAFVAYQCFAGLNYLHHLTPLGVVHRDIKPPNILVDHNYNVKIIDMGLARRLEKTEHTELTPGAGTRYFLAPERLMFARYGLASDVWSLGITLAYVIWQNNIVDNTGSAKTPKALLVKVVERYGALPKAFAHMDHKLEHDEIRKLISSKRGKGEDWKSILPDMRKRYHDKRLVGVIKLSQARDLISKMMKLDPLYRITMTEALRHPFVAPFRNDALEAVSTPPEPYRELEHFEVNSASTLLFKYVLDKEKELNAPGFNMTTGMKPEEMGEGDAEQDEDDVNNEDDASSEEAIAGKVMGKARFFFGSSDDSVGPKEKTNDHSVPPAKGKTNDDGVAPKKEKTNGHPAQFAFKLSSSEKSDFQAAPALMEEWPDWEPNWKDGAIKCKRSSELGAVGGVPANYPNFGNSFWGVQPGKGDAYMMQGPEGVPLNGDIWDMDDAAALRQGDWAEEQEDQSDWMFKEEPKEQEGLGPNYDGQPRLLHYDGPGLKRQPKGRHLEPLPDPQDHDIVQVAQEQGQQYGLVMQKEPSAPRIEPKPEGLGLQNQPMGGYLGALPDSEERELAQVADQEQGGRFAREEAGENEDLGLYYGGLSRLGARQLGLGLRMQPFGGHLDPLPDSDVQEGSQRKQSREQPHAFTAATPTPLKAKHARPPDSPTPGSPGLSMLRKKIAPEGPGRQEYLGSPKRSRVGWDLGEARFDTPRPLSKPEGTGGKDRNSPKRSNAASQHQRGATASQCQSDANGHVSAGPSERRQEMQEMGSLDLGDGLIRAAANMQQPQQQPVALQPTQHTPPDSREPATRKSKSGKRCVVM